MYLASSQSVHTDRKRWSKFADNVMKFSSITNLQQLFEMLFKPFQLWMYEKQLFIVETVIKVFKNNSFLAQQLTK